ncbi:hypothetical protein NHX12_009242, partial [Muraenolepis orangiensis]
IQDSESGENGREGGEDGERERRSYTVQTVEKGVGEEEREEKMERGMERGQMYMGRPEGRTKWMYTVKPVLRISQLVEFTTECVRKELFLQDDTENHHSVNAGNRDACSSGTLFISFLLLLACGCWLVAVPVFDVLIVSKEWHYYVINVEFPVVTLNVDGVTYDPYLVTDDWPIHPSQIDLQLTVGACWQGMTGDVRGACSKAGRRPPLSEVWSIPGAHLLLPRRQLSDGTCYPAADATVPSPGNQGIIGVHRSWELPGVLGSLSPFSLSSHLYSEEHVLPPGKAGCYLFMVIAPSSRHTLSF